MIALALALAAANLPRSLTAPEKTSIADAVRAALRDPQSAQFEWPLLHDQNVYCGLVNSKNGYGGYVGRSVYMALLVKKGANLTADPDSRVTFADDEGVSGELARDVCRNYTRPGANSSGIPDLSKLGEDGGTGSTAKPRSTKRR